jgi:dienelactone hydrolase
MNRFITLQTPHGSLHGQLDLPDTPRGLVLIARAHHAPEDMAISSSFAEFGCATLTMELLSAQEVQFPDATQNVPRLTQRLIDILDLTRKDGDMEKLPLTIFTSGDVGPAAIRAAAQRDTLVRAVACHGGLIDRAGAQALKLLVAPLLMLFDADDLIGKTAYQRAASYLGGVHAMQTVEIGEDPAAPAAIWFLELFSG